MVKPANFDSTKHYPVLMTQYSGPDSQEVLDRWGIGWDEVLASEGYIVACVDPRGTGARGEEFRKMTYGQLGKYETIDQVEAAKYLQSLSYVDSARIGIWGWSYGGFMTLTSLMKGNDVFKMGIAVAPVTNWRYYDSIYTERFMGLPQDNASGYDDNSPINHVDELKAKLLIVCGSGDDNVHMESEQGWSICLNKIREGKRVYYRYEDKNFSIKNKVINETEALQLKEMVTILNRFIGIPQFEWMEELLVRLETTINQKFRLKPIIGFEQNPFLKGLDHFSELYNAIQYKRVLIVTYQSFKQPKPVKVCLHPYYLKQYNNRWFLFALNEDVGSISNLALDRIVEIKERKKIYVENDSINFEEYFDDIVGVTVIENLEPTKVILHISSELLPYIESKPIHGDK